MYDRKKIELITSWPLFLDVFFYKDVGTFIKYLSHEYKLNAEIVMLENRCEKMTRAERFEGVSIQKIQNTSGYLEIPKIRSPFRFFKYLAPFKQYIKDNAKTWSHVMLFHANGVTYTLAKWVRRYNKNAKLYVKGDISNFNGKTQRLIIKRLLAQGIYFSCESTKIFSEVVSWNKVYKNRIGFIPNGIDDVFIKALNISENRENLIISTARFGATPKNSELLLDILDSIEYKEGWKVVLAGPIEIEEQDFQKYIDEKFGASENLRQHVSFIGNISNKEELFKLYSRAKVFMFTSRWEGASLSFIEAAYFGNYIITTDVGNASEILTGFNYGFIAPESKMNVQNIPLIKKTMTEQLQSIIDGKTDIDSERGSFIDKIRENYSMTKIIRQPFYKDFIGN